MDYRIVPMAEEHIALYERLGFAVEGVKRNAVRVDGKYENLVSMALLFDP